MSEPTTTPPRDGGGRQSLGAILRDARERKGLELSDVAEVTHVRRDYLAALEEGRYGELPEDVYSRNFLRLYGQAVGLDTGTLLDMYARERSGAHAPASAPAADRAEAERRKSRSQPERPPEPAAARRSRDAEGGGREAGRDGNRRRSGGPPARLGGLLATILMVGAVVGVAVWAFNSAFFNPRMGNGATTSGPASGDSGAPTVVVPPEGATPAAPGGDAGTGSPTATEQARDVLITVETQPPGAEVTVDGFPLPGATPVRDVPVTARASRLLRVTLDGYEPFEGTYDLSFDRTISILLEPEAQEAAPVASDPTSSGAAEAAEGPPVVAGEGQIALTITEPTWLEVYDSTARNQGQRLVYTTAQPGDRYVFDLPVYVHVGNAAGLHVSVNGQDFGAFGSSGAVTGRAFTP